MVCCSLVRQSPPRFGAASWRTLVFAAAAACCLQLAASWAAVADDANHVVARVNGTEIKAGDLAIAEEDLGANLPMTGDARRDYLTRYLADMQVIAQASEAKKLADSDD